MIEDKIINNSYDNVDYGTGGLSQQAISINPMVEEFYKESTTEHIEDLYANKRIMEELNELYEKSEYYNKYKKRAKKIERSDVFDMYYYFKDRLNEKCEYSTVQVFCAIAEFFDLNYKVLYNDVIALKDKAEILETLQNQYGLEKEFVKSRRLF